MRVIKYYKGPLIILLTLFVIGMLFIFFMDKDTPDNPDFSFSVTIADLCLGIIFIVCWEYTIIAKYQKIEAMLLLTGNQRRDILTSRLIWLITPVVMGLIYSLVCLLFGPKEQAIQFACETCIGTIFLSLISLFINHIGRHYMLSITAFIILMAFFIITPLAGNDLVNLIYRITLLSVATITYIANMTYKIMTRKTESIA